MFSISNLSSGSFKYELGYWARNNFG